HHLLRQVFARHVVDGVGEILMLPIGPLAARHRNEQPRVPVDDLEPSDHERVVQRDAHECLQLLVVAERNSNLRDLDHETVTSDPSLMRGIRLPIGLLSGKRPGGWRGKHPCFQCYDCPRSFSPARAERAKNSGSLPAKRPTTWSAGTDGARIPNTAEPLPVMRTSTAPAARSLSHSDRNSSRLVP